MGEIFYIVLWWTRNILGQLAAAVPQTLTVTPEEREAIQRVHLFYNLLCYLQFILNIPFVLTYVFPDNLLMFAC
jgi:hypothetical protein